MQDTLLAIVGACLAALGLGMAGLVVRIGTQCGHDSIEDVTVTITGNGPTSGEVYIGAHAEHVASA